MIQRIFPFLQWFGELRHAHVLRADLLAGCTVAMVLIPQSMAYAKLAGLPPIYGLYAAFVPPAIAALFGSSRHLATGPVAMASLISATAVQAAAPPDSQAYITYSILLALMVGCFRLGLGLLRLGALVNLLSTPVVIGFTNAAVLIIATSQLHHLFGVEVETGKYHYQTVLRVIQQIPAQIHWPTVLMSLLALFLLLVMRLRLRALRWFPYVLIAVIVTTFVAWALDYSGEMVGTIPSGLPPFKLPPLDWAIAAQLVTGALTLTVVGLMEAISIAKAIAAQTRQRLDINQELIGQGLANIAGSFFQSYAVSGSFSRSALNFYSGARTGFSSLVTVVVIVVVLLFFTPLLYYLPQATLAMIIVSALYSIIQVKPLLTAWRADRLSALIALLTFVVTLALAPRLYLGIALGVSLSLIQYIYHTMSPRVAFLARRHDGSLTDTQIQSLDPNLQVVILRFDGGLYYGASSHFENQVLETVAHFRQLKYLIVDAGGINHIDASGEQILRLIVERVRVGGVDVYISRAKNQVVEVLERTGTYAYIGADHFFPWNQRALEYAWDQLAPGYRNRCPYNTSTDDDRSPSRNA